MDITLIEERTAQDWQASLPDRVSLLHKGDYPVMAQRVRMPYRGHRSFVCHSTPHFGSTSRRDSYSVRAYHTRKAEKSK